MKYTHVYAFITYETHYGVTLYQLWINKEHARTSMSLVEIESLLAGLLVFLEAHDE